MSQMQLISMEEVVHRLIEWIKWSIIHPIFVSKVTSGLKVEFTLDSNFFRYLVVR